MTTWEYTLQPSLPEGIGDAEDRLNEFGQDGWELVGFRENGWLILKRAELSLEEIFGETWQAYRDRPTALERINTDAFRKSWPSPTIYREHEAIHILADMVDRLLQLIWCQPGQPHNPNGCDCGEGG